MSTLVFRKVPCVVLLGMRHTYVRYAWMCLTRLRHKRASCYVAPLEV